MQVYSEKKHQPQNFRMTTDNICNDIILSQTQEFFSANLFTTGIHVTSLYAGLSVAIPLAILSFLTFLNPTAISFKSSNLSAPHVNVAPVAFIDFSMPSFFHK